MYLADYHNHTCCSPDSEAKLEDMVRCAVEAGLSELCTTDHLDLLGWHGEVLGDWDWTPVLGQYERVRAECPEGFELRLGIELGAIQFFPERAQKILEGVPLDFVIGSVHNVDPKLGGEDFYFIPYKTEQDCYTALDDYFKSLCALAKHDSYDVIGHIIYPLRYMNKRDGHSVTLDRYTEHMATFMRSAIGNGRGIEVNTNRGAEVEAWRPVLELYRELGGEIITIGTDAHKPEDVGKGVAQTVQMLKDMGFSYYTVYRGRKPQFIKL
ncbi:MAG: histidinol-phosphatase HisJ family protein [Oscillospiraceae bacterium]|nr:histidinol-phosphatase HisJ family protein [Oscillospiraceae bacterium]